MTQKRLKHLLTRNNGGIWGNDPTGTNDTVVLRSTEQSAEGGWRIDNPAERALSPSERSRFRLMEDDIVVTKSSGSELHIGKASIVSRELASIHPVYSNFMQRLRVTISACPRFVWYLLNSSVARFHYNVEASSTSRLGNLTSGIIGNLTVPIVGYEIQKGIADFLDREIARIDQLIEKRARFAALAIERRDAMIAEAVVGGSCNDAWLSQLPEDWKAERSKFHFRENQRRSETGEEELLTVSHITGVTKRSEKEVYMFLAESNEGYKLVAPGDLVINTMWAWMGAMGVSSEDGLISPSYGVYRPISGALRAEFVDLLVRSKPFVAETARRSKGIHSSRLRLYPDAFLDILLPIPPLSTQDAILKQMAERTAKEGELLRKNSRAEELLREFRAALITAAVTGQIDVTNWGEEGLTDRHLDYVDEALRA